MLNRRQPPAGWAVRPASVADAPALARLCAAHAAYERLSPTPADHAERLADALDAGRLRAWLGWLDDEAVGYASATLDFSTLGGAPFLHLDCLYLEPVARGLSLGSEMLAAAVDLARALGCAELQWQTPVWNADAIRFYDRLGPIRQEKYRYTLALKHLANKTVVPKESKMEAKQYLVIQDHTSEFPKPITFKKGAPLTVGEKYNGPEGWENWIFCESLGQEGGWVPIQIIEISADNTARAREDYTARELTVREGELVVGAEILNGWVWCEKSSGFESGWVPLDNLQEMQQWRHQMDNRTNDTV